MQTIMAQGLFIRASSPYLQIFCRTPWTRDRSVVVRRKPLPTLTKNIHQHNGEDSNSKLQSQCQGGSRQVCTGKLNIIFFFENPWNAFFWTNNNNNNYYYYYCCYITFAKRAYEGGQFIISRNNVQRRY